MSPVMEAQLFEAQMQLKQIMDALQGVMPSWLAMMNDYYAQSPGARMDMPPLPPVVNFCEAPGRITVAQLVALWLQDGEKDHKVKPSTLSCYAHTVDKHIKPELGAISAIELTNERIELYFEQKLALGRLDGTGGLSPKSVLNIGQILKNALRWGARQKLIPINPIADAAIPKSEYKDMRVLTEDEQIWLEDYLAEDYRGQAMGVWLSLYLGLRVGEVCAVKWGDVDMHRHRVHIQRTLQRMQVLKEGKPSGETTVRVGPPKSPKSNRRLPIQDFLWEILMQYRKGFPEAATRPECYILQQKNGKYFEPRSIQRYFDQVCRAVGLVGANYHCLRHTFATRALERHMDYKTLSDLLGHASLEVTMRYAHALDVLKREEIKKLERISGK